MQGIEKRKQQLGSMDQLKNLLCWVAVEHFAYEIVEDQEEGKND